MSKVKVSDYNSLTKNEIKQLDCLTEDLSLSEQLWYIAMLSSDKVKIFIYRDFETVFFVPYRSKFGVSYAYMPPFIQKLNFIGSKLGVTPIMNTLFNTLRFGEISVSERINEDLSESCYSRERRNYILNLNCVYDEIKRKYAKNHIRNCKKASKIEVYKGSDFKGLISIFKSEKNTVFQKKQLDKIVSNLNKIEKCERIKKQILIYNAFENGRLIASIFMVNYNEVLYYILGASIKSEVSVSSLGLYRLFDYIIESHANQELILDFEGSDHPGIARFFRGFGATDFEYYFARWNKLPFPLKLFKN
jgi:hypothetical protein